MATQLSISAIVRCDPQDRKQRKDDAEAARDKNCKRRIECSEMTPTKNCKRRLECSKTTTGAVTLLKSAKFCLTKGYTDLCATILKIALGHAKPLPKSSASSSAAELKSDSGSPPTSSEDSLGIRHLGIRDLGVDSLACIALCEELSRRLGVLLDEEFLLANPSIEALATEVIATMPSSWAMRATMPSSCP